MSEVAAAIFLAFLAGKSIGIGLALGDFSLVFMGAVIMVMPIYYYRLFERKDTNKETE